MAVAFNALDLNLLKVFDAVMDERSVLRASQKVALSQSAVSHCLARLRETLGDDLFVRTAAGMQPTARALAMAPMVRDALKALELAVERPVFDPATAARRFTLAANDFVTMTIAKPLLAILNREAPGIDLKIKPVTRIDLAEQIDLGRIDAAIGVFARPPERFHSAVLFEYDDVLLVGRRCKAKTITKALLATLPLVVVSFESDQEGAVDSFISERGLARRSDMYDRAALEQALGDSDGPVRIAVTLPHFLAVPALLEDTDLAAIVPRPMAKLLADRYGLAVRELPFATTAVQVRALWHERLAHDHASDWLRTVLQRATQDLRVR